MTKIYMRPLTRALSAPACAGCEINVGTIIQCTRCKRHLCLACGRWPFGSVSTYAPLHCGCTFPLCKKIIVKPPLAPRRLKKKKVTIVLPCISPAASPTLKDLGEMIFPKEKWTSAEVDSRLMWGEPAPVR